ncbi:MAG TPA: RepB family plasmid replication initiator protein, partial [Clostridia bacterium]|nr:RepB family plasmid replication initiator protein [Clostridia bacterium]
MPNSVASRRVIVLERLNKPVEVLEISPTIETEAFPLVPLRRAVFVAAPKDYFLGPVFAATPQTGAREVTVGNHRYVIGGFHPMGGDTPPPPALDVRHARAIFALLSFRKEFDRTRLIRFSFNELCMRYAQSNGGRYAREIKKIVRDLMDSYIRITDTETNISHEFRLIERIDIEKRPPRRCDSKLAMSGQQEMWFNGCELSPEFAGLLSDFRELRMLNLDVFTSISSPLAQAIYLYIPSRAWHHNEHKPFEINLTNLLQQVSAKIPKHKSKRRELFTQNKNSIMQQLDGLETRAGIFRVRLAESADKSDWKLQAWVERDRRQ